MAEADAAAAEVAPEVAAAAAEEEAPRAEVQSELPSMDERKSDLEKELSTREDRSDLVARGVVRQGGRAAELDKALKKSAVERGLAGREEPSDLMDRGILFESSPRTIQNEREQAKSDLEKGLSTREDRSDLEARGVVRQGGRAAELDKALKKSAVERGLAGREEPSDLMDRGILFASSPRTIQSEKAQAAESLQASLESRPDREEALKKAGAEEDES